MKKDVIKQLENKIDNIPKRNQSKFVVDFIKLIEKAYDSDYENFNF